MPRSDHSTRTDTRGKLLFHGRFYGLTIFCCKRKQFCATPRESEMADHLASARLRNPVKMSANSLLRITNQLLYQLSYAGAAHMKAVLASSSRVRPTIALHHE